MLTVVLQIWSGSEKSLLAIVYVDMVAEVVWDKVFLELVVAMVKGTVGQGWG